MRVFAPCLLFSCLVAAPVFGQQFTDDFESGALLTSEVPAGVWDDVFGQSPDRNLELMAQSAHRGTLGLRSNDVISEMTSGIHGFAVKRWPQMTSGTLYLRLWFRVRPQIAAGNLVAFSLSGREARLRFPGPTWEVSARSGAANMYQGFPVSVVAPVDQWMLVEMEVSGLGTTDGRVRLRQDGALVAESPSLDWTDPQHAVSELMVGQIWADQRDFTGAMDYDDVRLSTSPLAARLTVAGTYDASSPRPNCIPIQVGISDSLTGTSAPAPYAFDAWVSSAEGTLHGEDSCSQAAVSTVSIPAGTTGGHVWFRPTQAGTATLLVSYPDFISGQRSLEIPENFEPPPPPPPPAELNLHMKVGCHCAEGAGIHAWWALAGLLTFGTFSFNRSRQG